MTAAYVYDKTTWGDGPWQDEPDFYLWQDDDPRYTGVMARHPTYGTWSGYAGAPIAVELFEWTAVDDWDLPLQVHGGITFRQATAELGIVHALDECIVREQVNDGIVLSPEIPYRYWFGFDCAHGGDVMPGMAEYADLAFLLPPMATYKDEEYVYEQVDSLIQQVKTKMKEQLP